MESSLDRWIHALTDCEERPYGKSSHQIPKSPSKNVEVMSILHEIDRDIGILHETCITPPHVLLFLSREQKNREEIEAARSRCSSKDVTTKAYTDQNDTTKSYEDNDSKDSSNSNDVSDEVRELINLKMTLGTLEESLEFLIKDCVTIDQFNLLLRAAELLQIKTPSLFPDDLLKLLPPSQRPSEEKELKPREEIVPSKEPIQATEI
jgi:hypothetical protein